MFGLNALSAAGIAGAFFAIVSGTICWQVAYGRGYSAASVKAEVVIADKNKSISVLNGDLGQCRGANANYHVAVAEGLRQIQAELIANVARQDAAARKNALADLRMLDAASKSAENSAAAREAILNAVDECVRSGIPADLVGVLNSILPER